MHLDTYHGHLIQITPSKTDDKTNFFALAMMWSTQNKFSLKHLKNFRKFE